jgi:hypothetical protein
MSTLAELHNEVLLEQANCPASQNVVNAVERLLS